jgi:hypothetical protein
MANYTLRLSPNFTVCLFHGYPVLGCAGYEELFLRMEDLRSLTMLLRASLRAAGKTGSESNRDFVVCPGVDTDQLWVARNSANAPICFSIERWELAALVCGLQSVLEEDADRHRWHCKGFLVRSDGASARRPVRPSVIPFLAA